MTKEQFLQAMGNDMVNELARVAPVDTSFLRNSIRYEVNGDTVDFYMPDYALFVEYGTQPHIIRPKNGKALHWKNGSKDIFATEVHHPGTTAQPFIRNTFYHKFNEILKKNTERYLNGISVSVDFK